MKLLVVGAGLIGSSVALAARQAGWDTAIADDGLARSQRASEVTTLPVANSSFQPDLICVAVPPKSAAKVISEQIRLFPNATVIDVASVKAQLVNEVESISGESAHYVPTHPMAGKESSGPESAAFDLFLNRMWVVCPRPENSSEDLDLVRKLITDCQGIVFEMSIEEHDQTVALTSHVPQVVATVLAGALNSIPERDVAVSGQGLRDMTRLAGSNSQLWTEILAANREPVRVALAEVSAGLLEILQALTSGDDAQVKTIFDQGKIGRALIPGKHGEPAKPYSTVSILIDDTPGQLAGIFATAQAAGVNVEDVRIDHALGREAAVVELDVLPDLVTKLQTALKSDGWKLRVPLAELSD